MARIKNNLTGDVFEAPARDFANEPDFTIVDSSIPVTIEPPPAVSDAGKPDTSVSAPAEQGISGSTDTPVDTQSSDQSTPTQTDPSPSSSTPSTTQPDGTAPSGDAGNVTPAVSDSSIAADVATSASATVTAPDSSASTAGSDAGNVQGAANLSSAPSTESAASISAGSDAGNAVADANAAAAAAAPVTAEVPNVDASTPPAGAATDASTAGGAAAPVTPSVMTPETPPTDSATGNPTGGPTPGNGATLDARGKHIVADQLEADMLFAIAQIITPTDSLKHAADAFFDQVRSQIDVEAAS